MKAAVRAGSGIQFAADVPIPTPGKGQVLLRVKATAINPVDYKLPKFVLGKVAGIDVAGVVEKSAQDVTRYMPPVKSSFKGRIVATALRRPGRRRHVGTLHRRATHPEVFSTIDGEAVGIRRLFASSRALRWRAAGCRAPRLVDFRDPIPPISPHHPRSFAKGDEVYGFASGGSIAEWAVADASKLARKPADVSFADAAALPTAHLTSYQVHTHRCRRRCTVVSFLFFVHFNKCFTAALELTPCRDSSFTAV